MVKLLWNQTGQKKYEAGVDRGVLFSPNAEGVYDSGVAWAGLTTVTETPSGAESTKTYADNIPYANIKSAEEFGATIEALFYPNEWAKHDGSAEVEPGVYIGQQSRPPFGFSWRVLIGNDTQGTDHGEKIHLVWGADAAPSEQANATINESPEPKAFSWEITTTPVSVGEIGEVEYKPTSHMVIDSTKVDATAFQLLKDAIYGTASADAYLPTPAAVIAMFAGTLTEVDMGEFANQPSYNDTTHVITLPAVTGVQWYVDGVEVSSGAQPALTVGETAVVTADAESGYHLVGDDDWVYTY